MAILLAAQVGIEGRELQVVRLPDHLPRHGVVLNTYANRSLITGSRLVENPGYGPLTVERLWPVLAANNCYGSDR